MKNIQVTHDNAWGYKKINENIMILRQTAEELIDAGCEIEAVRRNAKRILASIKMLELNICDLYEIEMIDKNKGPII